MDMMKSRKGYTIADIPFIAMVFGVGIIVLSIVGNIVSDVKDTQTSGSAEANISEKGLQGLTKIGDWLPTIGLVLGAVIVITALSVLFTLRLRQG